MAAECAAINPDRIKRFFAELENRTNLLTTITHLHKTLTDHFSSSEQSLSQKSQALDSEIEAFQLHTNETLESLQNREDYLPLKEYSAATRIEEQKQAAVDDIEKATTAAAEEGGGVIGEKSTSEILRMYCKRMDSKGLIRFMLSKRKESATLRTEIAAAVEEAAVDPMRLVLEAVEEFVEMRVKKAVGMSDRRWACGILIQVAVPVAASGVARSMRENAAGVMEKWKVLMEAGESGGMGPGEATMFLQMVIGFGLRDKFGEEYFMKLVVDYAARKDMPKLAAALGFGDKMKDIIDALVKGGKEIEALYFIYESGLKEQFPPVPLLKDALRNSRKNANDISRKGHSSAAAVTEANNSELHAIKAIIKCVEDYKLESEFGIDSLRKRVAQLDKVKSDKKRSAPSTSKPSNKRGHRSSGSKGGGGPSYQPPKVGRFSNPSPSFRHKTPTQSLHATSSERFSAPYNYASHSMYEGLGTASYVPGYGGGPTGSPAALSQQYPYAPQNIGSSGARAAGSYSAQASYGAYDYGAGAGSAYAPYPQ